MISFLLARPALCICISGFLLYIFTFIFYQFKIHSVKKSLAKEGKKLKGVTSNYVFSLILTFFVEILPALIPFSILVLICLCGCGIMGEIIVFRDRLEANQD